MVRLLVPALVALLCAAPALAEDAAAPAAPAAPAEGMAPTDEALMAAARLADIDYQRHLALTIDDLDDADQAKRILAIRELGRLGEAGVVPLLAPLLEPMANPAPILIAVSETMADIGNAGAVASLQRLLSHQDPEVRAAAQKSMTRLESMGAGNYMPRGTDQDDGIRASAVTNLGTLKHAEAAAVLVSALRYDPRPHARRMAAIGLGRLGDHANAPTLMDALCDADPGVRRYAAEALVRVQAVEAIPHLLMALEANIAPGHINTCLRLLSGQDFGFDPRANILDRTAAIERGYEWWAANAKTIQAK